MCGSPFPQSEREDEQDDAWKLGCSPAGSWAVPLPSGSLGLFPCSLKLGYFPAPWSWGVFPTPCRGSAWKGSWEQEEEEEQGPLCPSASCSTPPWWQG